MFRAGVIFPIPDLSSSPVD
ncbi:CDP-diacylglycerol--glycerol-3-phosphate 3-phosphatidyltransferase, partial [Trichinella spiralis]